MFRRMPLRNAVLLITIVFLAVTPARAGRGERAPDEQKSDLAALLRARDPEAMLSNLGEMVRKKVDDHFSAQVMQDSDLAVERNKHGLYPNPSLQAYVNQLALSLIPKEASTNLFVTFRIVEDPLPYADALATGTIYVSSGLISLLDNESQLSFVLMHEAGHVLLSHALYQIIRVDNPSFGDQVRDSVFSGIVGGVAGGLLHRGPSRQLSSQEVSEYSDLGTRAVDSFHTRRFLNEIEIEADRFATEVLLQNGFDAREAPVLMAKIADVVRRSGTAVDLAFGNARNLPQRSAKVSESLSGTYKPAIDRILTGEGFRMSSPRYSQLMSEIKRDNGLLALEKDLFAIARNNLEEAASVRTDDPLTMYGLGKLYRAVGRTQADRGKASGYFKSAMEFDEIRHRFPEAHLQYAVELLSREDPRFYPEIQRALKSFVALYQRQSGGALPREMRYVYDYLDLTGDRSWIAYTVGNVSSQPPYQFSGDPKIDGNSAGTAPPATSKVKK